MSIGFIGGISLSIGVFLFAYLNKDTSESEQLVSRIDKLNKAIKEMEKYKNLELDELASQGVPTTDVIIGNLDPRDGDFANELIDGALKKSIISSSIRYGECAPQLVAVKGKIENRKLVLEKRSKLLKVSWPILLILGILLEIYASIMT